MLGFIYQMRINRLRMYLIKIVDIKIIIVDIKTILVEEIHRNQVDTLKDLFKGDFEQENIIYYIFL